jgi:protein gp37
MVEVVQGKTKYKYGFIKPSWNPIVGCTHLCSYCWAKNMHNRKMKSRYFKPNFSEPELVYKNLGSKKLTEELTHIKKNSWVFVCDMGDLFCKNSVIRRKDIQWVIRTMKRRKDLKYLLATKNPKKYTEFIDQFPTSCYLGTTIETNKNEIIRKYSKAPATCRRYKAMKKLPHKQKFLGLEPLFDFDLNILLDWITEINPEIIAIGFDEHQQSMKRTKPDWPTPEKVVKLISKLRDRLRQYPEKRIYLTGEVASIYFHKAPLKD